MQTALNSLGLKSFNGSINLSTSFTGKAGDVVLATGSVDQTGTYVFEVEPQGVGASRSKFANYWGVSNGNDTMFTLWNPTSAAQDILVTFYYADGSGKYDLPVHLGPQASSMIDMAILIAEHKPDPEGHVIPSNIQEGSAQFASAKGRNEEITLVIAAGIYNVANATCISDCISCCGVSNFNITPSWIICPVGGTMSFSFSAVDCNGFTVWPGFSSSNTTVMTVDSTYLTVTGVSTGQATLTADWGNVFTTSNGGLQQFCGISSCPTTLQQTWSTVFVNPTLQIISFNVNPATLTSSGSVTLTVDMQLLGTVTGNHPVTVNVSTASSSPMGNSVHYDATSKTIAITSATTSPVLQTFTVTPGAVFVTGTVLIGGSVTTSDTGIAILAPTPATNAQVTLNTTNP